MNNHLAVKKKKYCAVNAIGSEKWGNIAPETHDDVLDKVVVEQEDQKVFVRKQSFKLGPDRILTSLI